jgi:O-antigen ligase
MGISITDHNPSYSGASVACIGALFFIELLLLALVGFGLSIIAIAGLVLIAGLIALYRFFNNPLLLLQVFLLSILAGSIDLFSTGSSTSQISFVDLVYPILLTFAIIRFLFTKNIISDPRYNVILILFGFFLAWSLFLVLLATDKLLSLAFWKNYFSGFIVFFFTLSAIRRPDQVKSFFNVLILWGTILAFISFYIIYSLGGISTGLIKIFLSKNLLATSWGKSNYLAAFYVLIIPVTIGHLLTIRSHFSKFLLSSALLVMFSAMVLTLSRGGIVSMVAAVLILISKILKPRTFVPLLLLISMIALILLLNPMTYVLYKSVSRVDSSLSYFSRLNFYKDVWNTILDYPITGVGIANLGYYSKFIISTTVASAHNIVLGMLGETGIVGASLFLPLLGYSFLLCVRDYRNEKNEKVRILQWSFISAFCGVLIHSMMEPNFEGFQFSVMIWSTLALFFRIAEMNPEDKAKLVG